MSSDSDQYIEENFNFHQVLIDWSEAVSCFYMNYKRLIVCIENGSRIMHNSNEVHIGQCPIRLLTSLLNTMHLELEKMYYQMDAIASTTLPGSVIEYKILTEHTAVIHELNQQATARLALAALSSC